MDKETERRFLDWMPGALVALPFDLKVLVEAVSDADLERPARESAVATIVHAMTPKDGQADPPLRFAEDVVQLRLALRRIVDQGGEGAQAFRQRFADVFDRVDEELALAEKALGAAVISWLDGRWPSLCKAVYSKKKVAQFVDDDEAGNSLYDESLRFATEYPITEKSISGKVKQVQPFVDHLARKRDQDAKKIAS